MTIQNALQKQPLRWIVDAAIEELLEPYTRQSPQRKLRWLGVEFVQPTYICELTVRLLRPHIGKTILFPQQVATDRRVFDWAVGGTRETDGSMV